jgi:hypothetical protein
MCDTAAVAFHKSFWVATSAAAPVIALAAVVALPDASAMLDAASRQLRQTRRLTDDHAGFDFRARIILAILQASWLYWFLVWGATVVNLIVQAGLLAVSLSALAFQQNVMPPWVAIALAVGGILLLAWSTTTVIKFRQDVAKDSVGGATATGESTESGATGSSPD